MLNHSSVTRLLNITVLLASTLFIVYGDARSSGRVFGGGGFIIWNCVPALLAFLVLERALEKATASAIVGAYVFSAIAVGLIVWCYASFIWWPPRGPAASTASIIFVFLPMYSIVAGGLVGVIVWGILRFAQRRKPSNQAMQRTAPRSDA
jgi:hypothetical protein